jgi:hypothetical protein
MISNGVFRPSVARVSIICAVLVVSQSFAQQQNGVAPASGLDSLTAPIALYPDALIAQILMASTDVVALQSFSQWVAANSSLKATDLQSAAEGAGFDASLIALAPFPQVVQMMTQQIEWTMQLGQAFTNNKDAVFDSIQRLRAKAQAAGNLKSGAQQQVETQTTSSGEQVIVIQPANPQVVYVPQYNPQTVYVTAPPATSTATTAAVAGAVGFTAGIIIGASMDNYYYGPYAWRGAAMYNEAWEDRYDYLEDRQENRLEYMEDRQERVQENAPQRQENQAQRQSDRQANQTQRQSTRDTNQTQRQTNQTERQSTRQTNQTQRQSTTQDRQAQLQATSSERQTRSAAQGTSQRTQRSSAAATSSYGGQTATQRSGTRSGGFSGYQSGTATRAERSRGSSSLSSSRGGGGGRRRR